MKSDRASSNTVNSVKRRIGRLTGSESIRGETRLKPRCRNPTQGSLGVAFTFERDVPPSALSGQCEWPTGPSVRRERWRSPPQGWLRLSRSPSQWSTGGRLRPQGRSAQSGFRLDIGEDAYGALRQGHLHAEYHLLRPSWGRIDAREQKYFDRWRNERLRDVARPRSQSGTV
jgi:hypothetical protein